MEGNKYSFFKSDDLDLKLKGLIENFMSSITKNDMIHDMCCLNITFHEIPVLDNEIKSSLCQISNITYIADTEKNDYLKTFAPSEQYVYQTLSNNLSNPDKKKIIMDFDEACKEIEENMHLKIEKEEDKEEFKNIDLWNWESKENYFKSKANFNNKIQNLQINTLIFSWYNQKLCNILQTVMQRAGDIKGDESESSRLFDLQCKKLEASVNNKYEEVKGFPNTAIFYADNPITHLISKKNLKEEDIAKQYYHQFTQEDLFKYLVHKRFVLAQETSQLANKKGELIIIKKAEDDKKIKFAISHLPYIMDIKRKGRITGIHVAALILWMDKTNEIKINQKNLMLYIKKIHGTDYKVIGPTSICEAMTIIKGKSEKTPEEKRAGHIENVNKYKKALEEYVSKHYQPQCSTQNVKMAFCD